MKKIILGFLFFSLYSNFIFADGNESPPSSNVTSPSQVPSQVPSQAKKKAPSFDHKHKAWTALLSKYVIMGEGNKSSKVNYKGFDKAGLNKYLKIVSSVYRGEFGKWTKNQQLAFYINAYNAYTIKLILDNYPIKSIRKISFFSPWKKKFFKLFDEDFFLDKIEHTMVRDSGKYKEARIHFAFNCASIGCPALLNEAWQAHKIEQQFDAATKNFLSDHSRNFVDTANGAVKVSDIFKWYGKDFRGNKMGYSSLKSFFSKYADSLGKSKEEIQFIKNQGYKITYSGYNWKLNE